MLAVTVIALLPMALLAAYQIHEEIDGARRNVERIAVSVAQVNAAEISRIIAVTETFLEGMARSADIRALDPARCGHAFEHFPEIYPHHSNLLTKDRAGQPVCSALPIPSGAKIDLAYYLDEVRHANGFAIGTPNLGPLSNRWVVPMDFPLRDDSGAINGTVSAPLDLLNFNPFVGAGAFDGLPAGTTATLFAPDMTMLARSLDAEKWIGTKRNQVPELVNLIARRSGAARFVSMLDGIERIHGAAPVPGTAWTTVASIPTAALDATVAALIRKWVGIGLLTSLASLALAHVAARRTAQPILAIAATAAQVGGGDIAARAAAEGSSEVVGFATAFNGMLDSLNRQQAELAASERRYRLVLDASSEVAIISTDIDGLITMFNRGAERMLGYAAAEMVGRATPAAFHLAEEMAARERTLSVKLGRPVEGFRVFVERAERNGQEAREWTYVRRDGALLTVSLVVTPIQDERGCVSGYLGVAQDVTAGKVAEAKVAEHASLLKAQATQLARSNAELEQFAYVASHDLRQPLRMISSYLGLIERRMGPDIDAELHEFLGFAVDGAKRLDRLIRDLLDYSRVGRQDQAFTVVALADAVADSLFNLKLAIAESGATIAVEDGLPAIVGSAPELTRLFQNLIGNAIKYRSPDRPSAIEVGCRQDQGLWLLWVKDNGTGIAASDRDRAFAVFQRLVAPDTCDGTGIGLAICRKIVEHHGGRIWIESEVGCGSTFLFTLPRGGEGDGCLAVPTT